MVLGGKLYSSFLWAALISACGLQVNSATDYFAVAYRGRACYDATLSHGVKHHVHVAKPIASGSTDYEIPLLVRGWNLEACRRTKSTTIQGVTYQGCPSTSVATDLTQRNDRNRFDSGSLAVFLSVVFTHWSVYCFRWRLRFTAKVPTESTES